MKTLTIQVNEDLYKGVRVAAIKSGMTLRDFMIQLMEKALEQHKEKDDTQ